MGKLGAPFKAVWEFADGWKSWAVALVAVYKLVCVQCASVGYVDASLGALGWDRVTGAFDAKEAVAAGAVIVALGHKLVKAVKQYKAGVPVVDLQSEVKPEVVAATIAVEKATESIKG